MAEYKGIEYLRRKLELKRRRVLTRYKYYEMKNGTQDLMNSIIPKEFKNFGVALGWCSKAVDTLADRLIFDGFDNDNFYIGEIYDMNDADTLTDSAVLGALISSCDFIYISADETGYPRMQVIDGGNATGVKNTITGLLDEGYAVLERDRRTGRATLEAYFTIEDTQFYQNGKLVSVYPNPAPVPLLVPIVNRPDAMRPFGHSQISRACMEAVQMALRTIKRMEITSEFYSFPQKYLLGRDDDAEFENRKATMSTFLDITAGKNGDKPTLGQFSQASMTPHIEQFRMCVAVFAGETGLTMDDLGFPSDNPSSEEAIKAAHESLRLRAEKAQRVFGRGLLNAGYVAACVRENKAYPRAVFYRTTPEWKPVFDPDLSKLSSIGDGVLKINQAVSGAIDEKLLKKMTGLDIKTEQTREIDLTAEGGGAIE